MKTNRSVLASMGLGALLYFAQLRKIKHSSWGDMGEDEVKNAIVLNINTNNEFIINYLEKYNSDFKVNTVLSLFKPLYNYSNYSMA